MEKADQTLPLNIKKKKMEMNYRTKYKRCNYKISRINHKNM